jgi:quercetin dioxygenase-like cupin family protein
VSASIVLRKSDAEIGDAEMETKITPVQPFVRKPATGSTLRVLDVTHIYKAVSSDTAGTFSLWETLVPPGAGAPPHTHQREDESFYMLSGELLFQLEGETTPCRLECGAFCFGARGRRHGFCNVSDQPARVLVLSTPSCGLDEMFAELAAATADGAPGLEKLAAITEKYGVTLDSTSG